MGGIGCTLSCILDAEYARVPAVYLAHAILALLAITARLEINNLRVCSGPVGSNPTRASNYPFHLVAPQSRWHFSACRKYLHFTGSTICT